MEEEEKEREALTAKEEKKHKAELLALMLLLLRRRSKRSDFEKDFASGIMQMRRGVSKSTANYLGIEVYPSPSKAGISAIAKNMTTRVGSIVSNSPIKPTPAEIVKIISPSIDKIVSSEVFQSHNAAYVDLIKIIKRGVDGYFMHSATLDMKTCNICRGLHGTKYPLTSSPMVNVHPRCRCILIFVEN